MRDRLLVCCRFDWSRISPAVFGSLFQCVMELRDAGKSGALHFRARILKQVRSLFLDDLAHEFERIKGYRDKTQLTAFHQKLGSLRFLDPACGCGNFLVVTYRELRLLEIEVLKALYGDQAVLDIHHFSLVDVDAMYGIEIKEFPVRIAEVALWLADHQMNQRLSAAFGQYFRLAVEKTDDQERQRRGDRLASVLPPAKCSFVMGNPPFVGKKERNAEQKADMGIVWAKTKGAGVLDYVTCWYRRALNTSMVQTSPLRLCQRTQLRRANRPAFCGHICYRVIRSKSALGTAPSGGKAKHAERHTSMS